MNITTDEETFSDIEMVRRNLAHFAPLKTTFRARPEVNARIMERIAQTFKVYQYVREEDGGIKYTEPWELFFWCGSTADDRRDMGYFYLMTNERAFTIPQRGELWGRLRDLLDELRDEDCEVCFEYHTEPDHAAMQSEALRIFRDCSGKVVEYNGKRGHLKWSERNGYYFMALRARKMGYILTNEAVCRHIKEIAA